MNVSRVASLLSLRLVSPGTHHMEGRVEWIRVLVAETLDICCCCCRPAGDGVVGGVVAGAGAVLAGAGAVAAVAAAAAVAVDDAVVDVASAPALAPALVPAPASASPLELACPEFAAAAVVGRDRSISTRFYSRTCAEFQMPLSEIQHSGRTPVASR